MLNNTWMKKEFNRLLKTTRPSRRQGKLIREGRNLRVESLEKRELLATFNIAGGAVFHGGFEDPSGFVYEARGANPASVYIQSNNTPQPRLTPFHESGLPDGAVARAGDKVLKTHVQKPTSPSSPFFFRQELQAQLTGSQVAGQDYWYGFSIYVPNDYQIDGNFESFLQFRTTGAAANADQPTLSLGVRFGQPTNIKFAGAVSNGGNIAGTNWDISTFKGKWTDFVIHAKWSSGSDGLIEIFRNEDAPIVLHGDNIIANRIPVMRIGSYKASWKTTTFYNGGYNNTTPAATDRTLFYDEQRVVKGAAGQNGIGAAGYNAVKPPGARPGGGGGGPLAPTASNDSRSISVGTSSVSIPVLANDNDPDGSNGSLVIDSFNYNGSNGSVSQSGNNLVYTPNAGFIGSETFTYRAKDVQNLQSNVATVTVTVTPVGQSSTLLRYDFTNGSGTTVVDQSGSGNTGTLTGFLSTAAGAGQFNVSEGWVNGGGINFLQDATRSYVETSLPLNTLAGKDATIEFTSTYAGSSTWSPAIGSNHGPTYSGSDAFYLGVNSTQSDLYVITPSGGEGAIGSNPWSASGATEHHIAITVDASSDLVQTFVDGVLQSTTTRPGTSFNSSDNFRIGNTGWRSAHQWDGVITGVAISDSKLSPGSFVLESGSTPVNQDPTANPDSAATNENTSVTTVNVLANDTDPDSGDTLSVASFTQPSNGTAVNNGNGTFTYTPNTNFSGSDSFTYTVNDGNNGTDVGTVSLTVIPVGQGGSTLLRYSFTNGSGTTVVDQSGNGNTGTLSGFSSTAAGAGVFNTSEGWVSGGGINFLDDSTRSFVETTLPLNSLAGKDATIEFTSSYAGASGFTPAIGSNHAPTFSLADAFFLGINSDQATLGVRTPGSGGGGIGSSPWGIPDATEHHIAMTFDTSTDGVEIFVDGVSVGTSTRSGTDFNSAANFRIGNTGWNSDEQWDGVITGVAISEGILTPGSFVLETGSGDFDSDGDVDGSDFLSWQRGLGSTHVAGDLLDWQDNYGSSSVVAAATAPDPVASVSTTPVDESSVEITGPAFLLSADMFSPVASQPATNAVLDEAFFDSGLSTIATQQDLRFEPESYTSTTLAQEETEEEENEASFADSLELAFQLL